MQELEYPFDSKVLRRKRAAIRRELLNGGGQFVEKKIAILGGSTTHDIMELLELFLLNNGIRPHFYESEYGQYWQDAMFDGGGLDTFAPEVIYIHTSNRNITEYPDIGSSEEEADLLLRNQYEHFEVMWEKLRERFSCPIIQNNFEYSYYRLLGNRDASDYRGRINFVTRLNQLFYEYVQAHEGMYINDINYQSAEYGLEQWSDPYYWYMYKYALSLDAMPTLAFNVANIIKSIYGKNKKALALDLDNTLWGGVVGDDGVENLVLGEETSAGQAYLELQRYLKALKKQGVLLNIVSKNDEENARAGLRHPQMELREEDFISIKANWEPKSANLVEMAKELALLPESFVFVDDNPAEREIIRQQVQGVGIAEFDGAKQCILGIDHGGYFEVTSLSEDDLKRNEMYRENAARESLRSAYADYESYLKSLQMEAEIGGFEPVYMARIAQLTNKSNQFNLTTRRYSQEQIEAMAADSRYICLCGRLKDRFGDNGIVSVVIGEVDGDEVKIVLWLMSCRVLKRDMEFAMMDVLVEESQRRGIGTIRGYYYPTPKNAMVKGFYKNQGFTKIKEDEDGNTQWVLNLTKGYKKKNYVIDVRGSVDREDERGGNPK